MTGFVVFAGLFALLAHRPHALPGVFELVIAHKAVMTVIAASSGDGATEVALGDGW